ncbi:MAG TPA: hypothetical protein VII82_14405 [Polyangiaceae bacterium]
MSQNKIALVLLPGAVVVAVGLVALRLNFQPPTVPEFAIAGATGDAGSGEAALVPGGRFEVELRPEAPVTGAIAARGFLLRGDEVRPWDPPFSVAADGTVRIEGTVDALFAGVPGGPWEVAIAVGRPETLPTAPNDILRARGVDARALSWRLVRERVFLRS